ncbi:unnamed protein product [Symbiodinium sp. CCMP2456]|nr:unnamed protein product [Symbiodinium sp. CCMP2456]
MWNRTVVVASIIFFWRSAPIILLGHQEKISVSNYWLVLLTVLSALEAPTGSSRSNYLGTFSPYYLHTKQCLHLHEVVPADLRTHPFDSCDFGFGAMLRAPDLLCECYKVPSEDRQKAETEFWP